MTKKEILMNTHAAIERVVFMLQTDCADLKDLEDIKDLHVVQRSLMTTIEWLEYLMLKETM